MMKLWENKPLLRSTDSFIPAATTGQYLEGADKILLIGDAAGRDWLYLKHLGKEITVLDIASQKNIPDVIVQSIEDRTPFEDESFDGVVMNDVIEHFFHDVNALEEIHRILKKDGVLVLTVPYLSNIQDEYEFHVRVYSPKTMRRLLNKCGFEIEEHFCRGFCCRLPQFGILSRAIIYSLHKLVEIITGKSPDDSVSVVNGFLCNVEKALGTHPLSIRFQKLFSSYGGIMKVRKINDKRNFNALQVETFKDGDSGFFNGTRENKDSRS